MVKKISNKVRNHFLIAGIKNTLICDCIGFLGLAVIGTLLALIKHSSIIKSIYLTLYFGGAFVLILSVPQFYKRNRRGKSKSMPTGGIMFGFYGWFGGESHDESLNGGYEQLANDGFWLGIMLFLGGLVLLLAGVVLENIYFGM